MAGPAGAAPGGYELVSTVGSDGKLEGCGVRVNGPDGASATVTLHREDLRQGRGPLELVATLPRVTAPIETLRLSTANSGAIENFVIEGRDRDSPIHASAAVDVDAAALLMRDVLLQGMTLSVRAGTAAPLETTFEGPASAEVIRGYLQCAGNMGR